VFTLIVLALGLYGSVSFLESRVLAWQESFER
jgi:ABC-type nitrate/sulfonate/bicarbonate transport system permease component